MTLYRNNNNKAAGICGLIVILEPVACSLKNQNFSVNRFAMHDGILPESVNPLDFLNRVVSLRKCHALVLPILHFLEPHSP